MDGIVCSALMHCLCSTGKRKSYKFGLTLGCVNETQGIVHTKIKMIGFYLIFRWLAEDFWFSSDAHHCLQGASDVYEMIINMCIFACMYILKRAVRIPRQIETFAFKENYAEFPWGPWAMISQKTSKLIYFPFLTICRSMIILQEYYFIYFILFDLAKCNLPFNSGVK